MATPQELAVRDKKELVSKEEKTVPGRYYVPYGDIYETEEALTVVLEMPGVEKKDLEISLENGVLRVVLPGDPRFTDAAGHLDVLPGERLERS